MKFSKSPFKMICIGGQVLNDAAIHENHAQFKKERKKLIDLIVKEKIKGVVFLTGDRHHTELSKIEKSGIIIYDLTVSPLTSGVHFSKEETNNNRVENTVVEAHNFGLLEFSGKQNERKMKITIKGVDNNVFWEKTIPQP